MLFRHSIGALVHVVSASGILKGFDPLLNLVMDGTTEYLRGKP